MTSAKSAMRWTSTSKTLAIILVIAIACGYLLSPLGLETRLSAIKTLALAPFFLTGALLIPIASLILLFRKPMIAGVLVVIDAVFIFFIAPADQAGFFFNAPPPKGVTVVEFVLIFVGVGYMLLGPKLRSESRRMM